MRVAKKFTIFISLVLLVLTMVLTGLAFASEEKELPAEGQSTQLASGQPANTSASGESIPGMGAKEEDTIVNAEDGSDPVIEANASPPEGPTPVVVASGQPDQGGEPEVQPQTIPDDGYDGFYGMIQAAVWNDTYHPDGVWEGITNEPFMNGVTINLYLMEGDTLIPWGSQVTAPGFMLPHGFINGVVSFYNLPTRKGNRLYCNYALEMIPLPGFYATGGTWRNTIHQPLWFITLEHPFCYWSIFYPQADPQQRSFSLAQLPPTGSISGHKWEDLNGNGEHDADEPGVSGITVSLLRDDILVDSTTTGEDGSYSFTGLQPDNYTVKEILVAPWHAVWDDSVAVVLEGSENEMVNFLNARPGTISGHKWEDLNNDGIHAPTEPGVPGVTIELWRLVVPPPPHYVNEDEVIYGAGAVLVGSTVTDEDGFYIFKNLDIGIYRVKEQIGGPWYNLWPTQVEVNLLSGGNEVANFLNARPGTVSGHKWEDVNGDGTHDGGENGVYGVIIELYNEEGLVASTATQGDGSYSFAEVLPGSYTVKELLTGTWYAVWPDNVGITIPSGGNMTVDFLNARPGTISGHKWEDTNGNGDHDSGEPPLGGVTITLTKGSLVKQAITADDGSYSFTDLEPGTYTVTETVPSGMTATSPASKQVVLASGGMVSNIDFHNAITQAGGEVVTPPGERGGATTGHLPFTGKEGSLSILFIFFAGLVLIAGIALVGLLRIRAR
jgi:hypothetical protein